MAGDSAVLAARVSARQGIAAEVGERRLPQKNLPRQILFGWIALGKPAVFLTVLFLAIVDVVSWSQFACVYLGISAVTLLLAGAVSQLTPDD
jgi:amino acid transporter